MFLNYPPQFAELIAAEPSGVRERYGEEPELSILLRMLDVDMRWFPVLPAPKEEPVAANAASADDVRHRGAPDLWIT